MGCSSCCCCPTIIHCLRGRFIASKHSFQDASHPDLWSTLEEAAPLPAFGTALSRRKLDSSPAYGLVLLVPVLFVSHSAGVATVGVGRRRVSIALNAPLTSSCSQLVYLAMLCSFATLSAAGTFSFRSKLSGTNRSFVFRRKLTLLHAYSRFVSDPLFALPPPTG